MRKRVVSLGLGLSLASLAMLGVGGCGCGDKPSDANGTAPVAEGGAKLSGTISIDGSSTVFPIVNLMGDDFSSSNPDVKVTVNKSGTGSGMQKFSRGEVDIATASRPIEQKEIDALKAASIDFIEVPIAYDGVSLIVNKENPVANVTPEQLKAAWSVESTAKDWSVLGGTGKITFYGPTDNHGTYEYFTDAINGKKGNIRKDYQANQDYNVVVQSVVGDKGGIGFVGFNYYMENKDKVKVLTVGGVEPTEATIADGTYTPLSRPLFIYVSTKAYAKPEVKAFVDYALATGGVDAVKEAKYVPLPTDVLDVVKKHVADGKTGSLFMDAKPGSSVAKTLAGS